MIPSEVNDVTSNSRAPITVFYVSAPGASPHAASSCDFDSDEHGVAENIFETAIKHILHLNFFQERKDISICVLGSASMSDHIMVGTPDECGLLPLSLKELMEHYCATSPHDILSDREVNDQKNERKSSVWTSYVACQGTTVYDLIEPYNIAATTNTKKGVTKCRRQCVSSADDALATLDLGRENQIEFLRGRYLDVIVPLRKTVSDIADNPSVNAMTSSMVSPIIESSLSSPIALGCSSHPATVYDQKQKSDNHDVSTVNCSSMPIRSSSVPSTRVNITEEHSSTSKLVSRRPLIEGAHSLIFSLQIRRPIIDTTTREGVPCSPSVDGHTMNDVKDENVSTLCSSSSVHFITFPDVTDQTANITDFDVFEECLDAMLTEKLHRKINTSHPPSSYNSPSISLPTSPLITKGVNINGSRGGSTTVTNSCPHKSISFSKQRCRIANSITTSSHQPCAVNSPPSSVRHASLSPKNNLSQIIDNCNNRLVTALAPTLEMQELQMGASNSSSGWNSVKRHVIFIICLSPQDLAVEEESSIEHHNEGTSSGIITNSSAALHPSALRNFGAKISQILQLNMEQYEDRNENCLKTLSTSKDPNTIEREDCPINDVSETRVCIDNDQPCHDDLQDKEDYYSETDVEEIENFLASPALNGADGESANIWPNSGSVSQAVPGDHFLMYEGTLRADEIDDGSLVIPSAELESIPFPSGWERQVTEDGREYFIDHLNKVTTWVDPRRRQYIILLEKRNVSGNVKERQSYTAHEDTTVGRGGDVGGMEDDNVHVSSIDEGRVGGEVTFGDRSVVKGDPDVDIDYAVMWEGERIVYCPKDGTFSPLIQTGTTQVGIMVIDPQRKKRQILRPFHILDRKKIASRGCTATGENSSYNSSELPQDETEESMITINELSEGQDAGWLGEDMSSDEDVDVRITDLCHTYTEVKKNETYEIGGNGHSDIMEPLEEEDDTILPSGRKGDMKESLISSSDMSYQVDISTHILELVTRKINNFCPEITHDGSSAYLFYDCTDPILRELLPGNEHHYLERMKRIREVDEGYNAGNQELQQPQKDQEEQSYVVGDIDDKCALTNKGMSCFTELPSYKRRLVKKSCVEKTKLSGEPEETSGKENHGEVVLLDEGNEEEGEEEWQERQLRERDDLISLLSDFESMLWRAAASEKLLKELLIQDELRKRRVEEEGLESAKFSNIEVPKEETLAIPLCTICGCRSISQLTNVAGKALLDREIYIKGMHMSSSVMTQTEESQVAGVLGRNDGDMRELPAASLNLQIGRLSSEEREDTIYKETRDSSQQQEDIFTQQPYQMKKHEQLGNDAERTPPEVPTEGHITTSPINGIFSSKHKPTTGDYRIHSNANRDLIPSKNCDMGSAPSRIRRRIHLGDNVINSKPTATHTHQSVTTQSKLSIAPVISSTDVFSNQIPPEEIKKIKEYYRLRHDSIFQTLVTKQSELVKKMYKDFDDRVMRERAKVKYLAAKLEDAHRMLKETSNISISGGNRQFQIPHNTAPSVDPNHMISDSHIHQCSPIIVSPRIATTPQKQGIMSCTSAAHAVLLDSLESEQ